MSSKKEVAWISFSDLMTALMVIFLFIAISYIKEVNDEKEKVTIILDDFQNTKDSLLVRLRDEFKDDFDKWEVELDEDLSIKFTNPDVLFAVGDKDISNKFEPILDNFLPRYFNIILSDRYRENILEVRIEGHTDKKTAWKYDKHNYIGNVMLSQARSAEVLKYFMLMEYYIELDSKSKNDLQYMLTANGLSYGRMLDNKKQLVAVTNQSPNEDYSRRVEFKIVTKTQQAIDKILRELKNNGL